MVFDKTYLLSRYEAKKGAIKARLAEFRKVLEKSDDDVFAELCFCLLTPQSKAKMCDKAIQRLKENGMLFSGKSDEIAKNLYGVRFPNNKSKYVEEARKSFCENGKIRIKDRLDADPYTLRESLVKNIKGLGYKEASHFLRNVGLGEDLAILDVHILKNLERFKVIDEIPKTLTRKRYLEIEEKMKAFARETGIPLAELDLLFWSEETGEIFK